MKIFEKRNLCCSLKSKGRIENIGNRFLIEHENPGSFEFLIEGHSRIIWPNREGEGFDSADVYPALSSAGYISDGISIAWPATASAQAVMVLSEGSSFVFHASGDCCGRCREITVLSDGPDSVRLRFTGSSSEWMLTELFDWEEKKSSSLGISGFQFQLGLKDPAGFSHASNGFAVITELAERFVNSFGPFEGISSIIHIFGYGEGHDMGYPDYHPSIDLGGPGGLETAARELHKKGFLLSCYLNARLVQVDTIKNYPELMPARCLGLDGLPVTETYYGREFFVMLPGASVWQEHLFNEAMRLKTYGVDAVQLDQVAGRAPAVLPAEVWGEGYKNLIMRLKSAGLKVWIQGVSDYYPANWFEMTYRDLRILTGGILRGGNPFGETDLRLLRFLDRTEGERRYIVPLEKAIKIKDEGVPMIVDLLGAHGRLPIYGDEYLSELSDLENRWKTLKEGYNAYN